MFHGFENLYNAVVRTVLAVLFFDRGDENFLFNGER